MKAIVLETKNGRAAVLREDGAVVEIRRDCQVGQTLELDGLVTPLPLYRRRWLQAAAAAALALVVLTGSYAYTTASACAYVSLDVGETSVEVAVNRRGRVIAVSPLNEDSAEVAQALTGEMRSQKVAPAMNKAMEHLRDNGYLPEDEDEPIIAGVTSDSEKQAEALTLAVESSVAAADETAQVVTLDVTSEERADAGRRSMSGGRYVMRRRGMRPPRRQTEGEAEQTAPAETTVTAETDLPAVAPQTAGETVPARPQRPATPPRKPRPQTEEQEQDEQAEQTEQTAGPSEQSSETERPERERPPRPMRPQGEPSDEGRPSRDGAERQEGRSGVLNRMARRKAARERAEGGGEAPQE